MSLRRLSLFGAALCVLAGTASAQQPPPPPPLPAENETPFLRGNPKIMTPEVRERLAELLQLPKEKLWDELMKWPAFREMSLQEQANFVNRLAEMRQRIRAQALKKAADLGIRLTPEQEQAFIASYLQERMAIEKKIWQETQAKRRELDEQLKSNLRKQYAGEPPEPPAAAR